MAISVINVCLTASIVLFACFAWRATRTYARMTALSLLIQQARAVAGKTDSGERQADIQSIKLIKAEFPDLYERIKVALGSETQKEIEDA